MNAIILGVGEEDIAVFIDRGTFGESEALAQQIPFLARLQKRIDATLLQQRGLCHRLGIILPQPAQRIRQNRPTVLAGVALGSGGERALVAGILKRGKDLLISYEPVAGIVVLVGAAILQEDPQRFGLGLADERSQQLSAAKIGEAADKTQHAAEGIRPGPRRIESSDAAGARAGDSVIIRIFRQVVALAHLRQNFLDEEARIAVTQGVIFKAAVVAVLLFRSERRQYAGIDEDANGHRHVALVDQVVKDDGDAKAAGLVRHSLAILKDHDAGRLFGFVLCRDINPVVACGRRIDLARP